MVKQRSNSVWVECDGTALRLTRQGAAHYLRVGRSLGYQWRYSIKDNIPCWSGRATKQNAM